MENVISKVETLDYSGLLTVEAIQGGFETPLIDEYDLRGLIPDIQEMCEDTLAEALKARRKVLGNRKRVVVGRGRLLGGYEYDIVEYR